LRALAWDQLTRCRMPGRGSTLCRLLFAVAILVGVWTQIAVADVPAAPSNLTAEVLGSAQVRLTWQDNSYNEDTFEVWHSELSHLVKRHIRIATLPPNTTTYDAWFPGACGTYTIEAVNEDGHSGRSNSVTVGTLTLTPPVLVARAVSAERIDITWEDANYCQNGYEVWRVNATPGVGIARWSMIASLPRDASSYADTMVYPGITYSYYVNMYTSFGSEHSNCAQAIAYAPTNLIAMPASSTRIDLAWEDGINYEEGYTIQRSNWSWGEMQWGPWAVITNVDADNYSDGGLASGSLHRYQVRAYWGIACSAWSNVATAVAVDVPPFPPSDLTASSVSSNRIDLTWQDNSDDETKFKIERKPQGGTYSQIATVEADVTTFSSTGLSSATTYCYRVRAYSNAGNSAYSDKSCATTSAVPPIGPSDLNAGTASSNQIDLTWYDNSSDEIGFKIGRGPSGGPFSQIAVVGANTTSYSNTGLNPGMEYCYLVMAYNAAGNSTSSKEACATTSSGSVAPDPPNAPVGLSAVGGLASQINLTWNDKSNNEAGFYIEREPQGGSYEQIAMVAANVEGYADADVDASSTYCYRVRAYNSLEESAYTDEDCATTAGMAPNAPSDLTAGTVSSNQINLTWHDNSSDETGFKIERKAQGGSYAQIAEVGASTTSYSNTGLVAGTTYCYRVRAYNTAGDSGYSNGGCAIAYAPANLVATAISSTRIDLAWEDALNYEEGVRHPAPYVRRGSRVGKAWAADRDGSGRYDRLCGLSGCEWIALPVSRVCIHQPGAIRLVERSDRDRDRSPAESADRPDSDCRVLDRDTISPGRTTRTTRKGSKSSARLMAAGT